MGRRRVLVLVDHAALNPATQALLDFAEKAVGQIEFRFAVLRPGNLSQTLAVLGPVWQVGHNQPETWQEFGPRWSPEVLYAASIGALHLAHHVELPLAPGILFVYDEASVLGKLIPGLKSPFVEWPELYVAPSQGCADFLSKRLYIPAGKTVTSQPRMTPRRFAQLVEAPRPSREKFTIGSIGGIDWLSGPILCVYLTRELIQMQPSDNFSFQRFGSFPGSVDGHRFRHAMRLLEVESRLELVHDNGQMSEFLTGLDILAVPSWTDTAPAGVLEAMVLGIPVVCFKGNAAVADTIGDTGITIDGYDTREMARAIHQLAADQERIACIGMKQRKRVEESFLDPNPAQEILGAIQALAVSN